MAKSLRLPFAAIALFLLALPAALGKPGLPFGLRADEATWVAMAASLAHDGDLQAAPDDFERLFTEFPFSGRLRVAVAPAPEGEPTFAEPLLYPLLAAPFVAALGANGLLVLNMALLLAAVALAGWRLGRTFEPTLALLFAFGFFLFSPAFAYVFWHRPSVLLLALGTVAAVLAWPAERPAPAWQLAAGGLALGLAALSHPMLLLLALPIAGAWWPREEGRRQIAAFGAAALLGFAAGAVVQQAAVGDWLGRDAVDYVLTQPDHRPWVDGQVEVASPARPFTVGRLLLGGLLDQRRGFLPYFPLAVCALLWWRLPGGRRGLALGLALLIAVQPWLGELDPELLANPALLALLPFFLLFVDVLPPRGLIAAYGIGMLCAGPYLNGLLGSTAPDGGIHGHHRNLPYRYLPLDLEEVTDLGGFLAVPLPDDQPGIRFLLPADVFTRIGEEVYLLGGESAEFFVESPEKLREARFQIRSVAVPNLVVVATEEQREELHFQERPAITHREMRLGPGERNARGRWLYRFEASAERGAKPYWFEPTDDVNYIGVALAWIGTPSYLARDVYALRWTSCSAPARLRAGKVAHALAGIENRSAQTWPSHGASLVRVASRWLDAAGKVVAENPDRSSFVHDVAPGAATKVWLQLQTPAAPGVYQLELDAVRENVAWFADRTGGELCRTTVEVVP
jgi:hypothetical protein